MVESIIREVVTSLGITSIKKEQQEAIGKFVFVGLLTGYGNSLCYACLPLMFDRVQGVKKRSIALVVSPRIAFCHNE